MSDKHVVRGDRDLPIQIDRALVERDAAELGVYALAVYAVLCLYENHPQITPSQADIAEKLGVSRNTVKTAIAKLVEAGWVTVEKRFNFETKQYDSSIYHLQRRPEGGWSSGDQPLVTTSATHITTTNPPVEELWLQLTGGYINGTHAELLQEYEREFGYETVRDAIKEAAGAKSAIELRTLTPHYLLTIMRRWAKEGRPNASEEDGSGDDPQWPKVLR